MRNIYLALVFLMGYFFPYQMANAQKKPPQFAGFGYDLTAKIPSQGMLFGPLQADKTYRMDCHMIDGAGNPRIAFTICYEGVGDKNKECSANTKNIYLTTNTNSHDMDFSVRFLKPIKLDAAWKEKMKVNIDYGIELQVESLEKLSPESHVVGNCNITEE
jgi:hypothetical protein